MEGLLRPARGLIPALAILIPALAAAAEKELTFDHALHLSLKLSCVSCHGAALKSEAASDLLLPGLEFCAGCHPKQSEGGENSVLAARLRDWGKNQRKPADLVFPHKSHLELGYGGENSCKTCHAGIENSRSDKSSEAIPPMTACGTCHDIKENSKECSRCHLRQKALLLKPLDHDGGFLQAHRAKAASDKTACLRCHDEAWCADCHATLGNLGGRGPRARHHELGYRALHPLEAKEDGSKCQRCHAQQECLDCHQAFRSELMNPEHKSRFNEVHKQDDPNGSGMSFKDAWAYGCRNCHDPIKDFELDFDTWHGDHAAAARRDIQECGSCHAGGKDCVVCHGVSPAINGALTGMGPLGANPHDGEFYASVNREGGPVHRAPANCFTCHARQELCGSLCHGPK